MCDKKKCVLKIKAGPAQHFQHTMAENRSSNDQLQHDKYPSFYVQMNSNKRTEMRAKLLHVWAIT